MQLQASLGIHRLTPVLIADQVGSEQDLRRPEALSSNLRDEDESSSHRSRAKGIKINPAAGQTVPLQQNTHLQRGSVRQFVDDWRRVVLLFSLRVVRDIARVFLQGRAKEWARSFERFGRLSRRRRTFICLTSSFSAEVWKLYPDRRSKSCQSHMGHTTTGSPSEALRPPF
jgi:hypothetical protein